MEAMEIDLDFEDDPIKRFLQNKLDEVKCNNENLERELEARNDLLKLSVQETVKLSSALEISKVWKRIFDSKCIFGIVIEGKSATGFFQLTGIMLNWNSSELLTYSVRSFRQYEAAEGQHSDYIVDEWICTDSIRTTATVLVTVEKPTFHKQLAYDLEGCISYGKDSESFQVSLSGLCLSAGDYTDSALEIRRFDLKRGKSQAFLCYLAATEATDFVGRLPTQAPRKLETVMAIDCMFLELDVKSKKKKYFAVDGISSAVDGCLIELLSNCDGGPFYFKILSRDEMQTEQLLHYLHKSVEGIIVLPKSLDIFLLKRATLKTQGVSDDDGDVPAGDEHLRQSLLNEISYVEDFCAGKVKDDVCSGKDYLKFRDVLSDLEYETDVAYSKYLVPSLMK